MSKTRNGYVYKEIKGVGIVSCPELDKLGILNAFSTRVGGVSKNPYDSLNLGLVRPDNKEHVKENYRRIALALGVSIEDMVLVNYCHGNNVVRVGRQHRGNGLSKQQALPQCDALITNEPGVVLVTIHADCNTYFIYDPVHNAIASCHAGWKGTLMRIGQKTLDAMSEHFDTKAADCIIGIGPAICGNCFEVELPVADDFMTEFPDLIITKKNDIKFLIDLIDCSEKQFLDYGVRPENMSISNDCTFEMEHRYYSFRRDGQNAGAMAGFMSLHS